MNLSPDMSLKIVYIYDIIFALILAYFAYYFLIVPLMYFSTLPPIGLIYGIPFLVLAVILFKISFWIKKRNKYGFYGNLIWLFISIVSEAYGVVTGDPLSFIRLMIPLFILYLLLRKDVRSLFIKK